MQSSSLSLADLRRVQAADLSGTLKLFSYLAASYLQRLQIHTLFKEASGQGDKHSTFRPDLAVWDTSHLVKKLNTFSIVSSLPEETH